MSNNTGIQPERDPVTGWLIFQVDDEVKISTTDPRLYVESRNGYTGKIVKITNPNTYSASYVIELKHEPRNAFYNGKMRRVDYSDIEFISRSE